MNKEKQVSCDWLGRTLTIKTGKLALHANSAVTVQYGDTVILATATEAKDEREGIDFFPLMVDFEERLYAAGIIKGSRWIKREGRPSDDSVLTGRMIDRAVRPLFNESSRRDVQVVITVLSADQENDFDIISLIAASAALSISGIKWNGPIGGIRVGRINNELVFNPTYEQRAVSDFDLIVSGTEKKVIMLEAGGQEIKEADMFAAIMAGQEQLQGAIALIKELQKVAEPKVISEKKIIKSTAELEVEKEREQILNIAKAWLATNVEPILFDQSYYTKTERKAAVEAIKVSLDNYLFEQNISKELRGYAIKKTVSEAVDSEITKQITINKRRVDGRALTQIRALHGEVEVLPRNHGAGLFSRGETQVMSIVTLGAPGLVQHLEGMEGTDTKRFMHHYNFPPFSVGEARPMRGPGRREVGHGALAEKALYPMIPVKEEFPYTIRVVSETLGSNGSSSMASTCASCLALMDAGVPIKRPVAGIAMGLASNEDMSKWEVLTDLQDLEDGKGGMDFKIAGTSEGITAIQLDTKTDGLTAEIIKKTLEQGYEARLEILNVITGTIPAPRADLSPYAPRITSFYIDPERIREVIGPGGKVINKIIAETGVSIDIEEDGLVMVCGTSKDDSPRAVQWIKDIVREFTAGEIIKGKAVRFLDFGVFVELAPGKDGMVHVSEMAPYRVGKPSDMINIGDEVTVKIKEVDDKGRINLTMKDCPENEALWKDGKGKAAAGDNFGRDNGGFNRPPRRNDFRGPRRDDRPMTRNS